VPDERHGGGLLLDEPGEDVQHGGRLASAPSPTIIRIKAPFQERQDNLHTVHNFFSFFTNCHENSQRKKWRINKETETKNKNFKKCINKQTFTYKEKDSENG
jgi:hypothetical protein